jgi:Rieske Fe-S protein
MTTDPSLSRRSVLTAGAVGVGAVVLGACSSDKKKTTSDAASTTTDSPSASPSADTPSASPAATGGATIAALSTVPVGGSVGAKGPDGKPIMLSQPTAGNVVAFSAICTHKGCPVAAAGKEFHCPCHGSIYDAATGAVKGGPAPRPLTKIDVHVVGANIVAGA